MNNKIKEILDDLRIYKDRYEYFLFNNLSFSDRDYKAKILLDYITNLQQIQKEYDYLLDEVARLENEKEINKYKTLKNLQDRIDKAIIFLKEAQEGLEENHFDGCDPCLNECINILKGEENE